MISQLSICISTDPGKRREMILLPTHVPSPLNGPRTAFKIQELRDQTKDSLKVFDKSERHHPERDTLELLV